MQGMGASRATWCRISLERKASAPRAAASSISAGVEPAPPDHRQAPDPADVAVDPERAEDGREPVRIGRGPAHEPEPEGDALVEAEQVRQAVVDPAGRVVEVRVHRVDVEAVPEDDPEEPGRGALDPRHGDEERRVVDHEDVGAERHRLPGHPDGRVEGRDDPVGRPRPLDHEPDPSLVARLGEGRRRERLHLLHERLDLHAQAMGGAGQKHPARMRTGNSKRFFYS